MLFLHTRYLNVRSVISALLWAWNVTSVLCNLLSGATCYDRLDVQWNSCELLCLLFLVIWVIIEHVGDLIWSPRFESRGRVRIRAILSDMRQLAFHTEPF